MGNTIDSPFSPRLTVYSLTLVEEIKPDFESLFRELSHLMDCRMEELMDFDRIQNVLIKSCNQLLSKVKVITARHWDELHSRSQQLLEEQKKKTKLNRDQEVGIIMVCIKLRISSTHCNKKFIILCYYFSMPV